MGNMNIVLVTRWIMSRAHHVSAIIMDWLRLQPCSWVLLPLHCSFIDVSQVPMHATVPVHDAVQLPTNEMLQHLLLPMNIYALVCAP
jgi:hypothetical protein